MVRIRLVGRVCYPASPDGEPIENGPRYGVRQPAVGREQSELYHLPRLRDRIEWEDLVRRLRPADRIVVIAIGLGRGRVN